VVGVSGRVDDNNYDHIDKFNDDIYYNDDYMQDSGVVWLQRQDDNDATGDFADRCASTDSYCYHHVDVFEAAEDFDQNHDYL
jgi:hypothetical protein